MPTKSVAGLTPRQSVQAECDRRGKTAVVNGCVELLAGRTTDSGLVVALGGPPARWSGTGREGSGPDYWLRVWAARGLLWAWEDAALPTLVAALCDDSWRVRELAAKVVARHGLGEALEAVAALRDDPVLRVRAAAGRAVVRLTAAQD